MRTLDYSSCFVNESQNKTLNSFGNGNEAHEILLLTFGFGTGLPKEKST